jgi:heme exporter protein C
MFRKTVLFILLIFMGLNLAGIFLYVPRAKWTGSGVIIHLISGEKIKGKILKEEDNSILIKPAIGDEIRIKREDISRVEYIGDIQRIFYFHVPLAWTMFLSFFLTFIFSIAFLVKKEEKWDIYASSSAEVGVLFATLAILTGALWAKPAWGTFWTWDPRLTTMLTLWFIFVGYLILRNFVEDPELRARLSAVIGIIGFVDVPLVFLSVRLWRSLHPVIVEGASRQKFALGPKMLQVFLFSLLVFTILCLFLIIERVRIEKISKNIETLKR